MNDPRILVGDCREQLANIADNSVDAIITDPPYELGFMGNTWDNSGVAYDIATWAECLRVLKPGGHLCAFGGTRTYHRMTVAIEDAGFEIRDSIHWLYGSGFPKSLDVSKAIDKQRAQAEFEASAAVAKWLVSKMDDRGITRRAVSEHFQAANIAQQWTTHWTDGAVKPRVPRWEQWLELRAWLDLPDDMDAEVWRLNGRKGQPGENWGKRAVVGRDSRSANESWLGTAKRGETGFGIGEWDLTAPATAAAAAWEGWGTALKPAHEPIVLARKPFPGTVAQNVLEHDTGALNIDATRIGDTVETWPKSRAYGAGHNPGAPRTADKTEETGPPPSGRWPANILITHHHACTDDTCTPDCPTATLDTQSGHLHGSGNKTDRGRGRSDTYEASSYAVSYQGRANRDYGSQGGGASRFFTQTRWDEDADVASFRYVAKPSKRERNAGLDHLDETAGKRTQAGGDDTRGRPTPSKRNTHPTVKPVALIRWLIRLTTTADALILDPFLGSGTAAVAAILEHRNWIGCELTTDYLPIIQGRIAWAEQHDDTATPIVPRDDTTSSTADVDPLTLFEQPK